MEVELLRLQDNGEATLGCLRLDKKLPGIWTLEEPWRNNERNVSCIPEGAYRTERVVDRILSVKKYDEPYVIPSTFEVTGVSGRSGILFHPGNTVLDTRGCILLGLDIAKLGLRGYDAVTDSRVAFNRFLHWLKGVDEFTLTICTH
jgi:hypothetical protein